MRIADRESIISKKLKADSDDELDQRCVAEHAELRRMLSIYRAAIDHRDRQKTEQTKIQSEADELGTVDLTDQEIGARIAAVKRIALALADSESKVRAAQEQLKQQTILFHGTYFNDHKAHEEVVTEIISEDVRVAARWGSDGSGLVLTNVLRFSSPIKELNALFPQRLPQLHEQKDGDWWAGFAADLIGKFSRLMEFKESFV
jgi:hypothetical protein